MTAPTQSTPPQQTQPARHEKPAQLALARLPEFNAALDANSKNLTAALGSMVPVEYFARVAKTAMRKQPLLQQASLESVMGCLMDIAQLRLVPDSVLGEAYMVPFWDSKSGVYVATLMIGYKGYVKMLRRNGKIKNVHAEVVYEKDEFVIQHGSQRQMIHVPHWRTPDRGEPLGAYAFIEDENGQDFKFVPKDYIERVKASSKSSDKADSPWNTWPESMWCKTALRQLMKTADISPDVSEAVSKDLADGAIDVTSTVVTGAPVQQSGLIAAATPAQLPPPSEQPANFAPAQQTSGAAPVARQPKPRRTVVTAPAASPVTPSPAAAPAMAATPAAAPEPSTTSDEKADQYANEAPAAMTQGGNEPAEEGDLFG